ncbi:MAG: hypothetical protein MUC86_11505, partial [Burkholderiaceae bacterium]|nr:hypothetical protein [Burkholderiaceae bacterium]
MCAAIRVAQSRIYAVDVSSAALKDPAELDFLNRHPTALAQPAEAVDRLRAACDTIIAESPDFQRPLKETGVKILPDAARRRGRRCASGLKPAVGDTVTADPRSQRVAERTEAVQTYRNAISVEAAQRELRLCGFALLNHYLTMHQVIAQHVHLQPVELLILIATTTGNVQRTLRAEALPEALRGSEPLPPELAVPMSRRAIA